MADTQTTPTDTQPAPAPGRPVGSHRTSGHLLLDGEVPRLTDAPAMTPRLADQVAATLPTLPRPSRPDTGSAGDLASAPTLPTLPTLPSLPSSTPMAPMAPTATTPTATGTDPAPDPELGAEPRHPMAHLMPKTSVPSEASRRAAEARAVRKAKAKKIKISVAAGLLVVTALVGPPLGRWLVDAINEAGSTTTVDEGTG